MSEKNMPLMDLFRPIQAGGLQSVAIGGSVTGSTIITGPVHIHWTATGAPTRAEFRRYLRMLAVVAAPVVGYTEDDPPPAPLDLWAEWRRLEEAIRGAWDVVRGRGAPWAAVRLNPPTRHHLADALAAAREIKDAGASARALIALAARLPPELLPEALAAAREIKDEYHRAEALTALAARLPEVWPEALAAAREIKDADASARALIALAERFPDLLPEALAAAREIKDANDRARALTALAEHFSQVRGEALTAARKIEDADDRAHALTALAARLPPELMPEALAAAREIKYAGARAEALTALAARLPEVLPEALAAAREIWNTDNRARALAALAPRLAELPRPALYPLWDETLPVLARRTRPDLLADLRALVPVIHALGGEPAIAETARAIQDTARWWP